MILTNKHYSRGEYDVELFFLYTMVHVYEYICECSSNEIPILKIESEMSVLETHFIDND